MASTSVTELLEAVERPESMNVRPLIRRSSDQGTDKDQLDGLGKYYTSVTTAPPPRRNSHAGIRTSMQRINEVPDKKPKKTSRRHSFMGYMLHASINHKLI